MLAGAASRRSGRARSTNWLTAAAVRSARGLERPRGERRHSKRLRVGLRHRSREAVAAEHENEAVLLHRLDEHLHAVEADRAQPLDQANADLGADAPGAPVGDVAARVHGAEVAARGDVARLELEVDAEGLEHAPAHRIA